MAKPTPEFLPGESHGQRSLVGYSPWGLKELDMTGRLHFTFGSMQYGLYLTFCIFIFRINDILTQ